MSPIPDMDADGVGDIAVGCEYCNLDGAADYSGIVWLLSGVTGVTIRTYPAPHSERGGQFGSPVVSVPDLNADGVPDLIIGARLDAPAGGDASGVVYAISGADGAVIQQLSSPRPVEFGWFGQAIAPVPDANGDGRPEVVVTAPGEYYGQPGRQAYLFLSCRADYNADSRLDSQDLFAFLGAFFSNAADFNADGTTNSQDFFDFLTEFFAGCG